MRDSELSNFSIDEAEKRPDSGHLWCQLDANYFCRISWPFIL